MEINFRIGVVPRSVRHHFMTFAAVSRSLRSQEKKILGPLAQLALRLPRLSIALFLLALIAVVGIIAGATYLVIGVASGYLGTSRFVAGLLLGVIFARFPRVHQGQVRTIGVIPKRARPWVMVTLLALCSLHFLLRGEIAPMLVLAIAAVLPLVFRKMKNKLANRMLSPLFRSPADSARPAQNDDMIIDAEFREKKD